MSENFWKEAKKYRTTMQLIIAGWIPFGITATYIWIKVLELKFDFIVSLGILFFWYILYLRTAHKFKKLNCPNCGQSAFGHAPSILTEMKCIECGFQDESSLNK